MNVYDLLARILLLLSRAADIWDPSPQVTPAPATGSTVVDGGLGAFTWAQVVTLSGAAIAAGAVVLTLLVNAGRARRETWATLYADALGAVGDYLEGPYRILRKDGQASTRLAITSKLSDVKAAIDHSQALLRLHCDVGVADAFDRYVLVAQREAGQQMHDAWRVDPVETDAGVNLDVALPRAESPAARALLVDVMQAHLRRRWYSPSSRTRYKDAVTAGTTGTVTGA